jgi:hypothetical protein
MSIIEANITIDDDGNGNVSNVIQQINQLLQSINNKNSQINVNDIDNPIHNSPIKYRPSGA